MLSTIMVDDRLIVFSVILKKDYLLVFSNWCYPLKEFRNFV